MSQQPPEQQPLLSSLPSALVPPPVLVQAGVDKLKSPVTLDDDTAFPVPTFTTAYLDKQKRRMPQCIAHRGFKAKVPENTMLAFREAVKAGVHALETDVHITRDQVVVLSHDAGLKRCFGVDAKVIDTTWSEIERMRTIAEPHVSMPRLQDLLEYLATEADDQWLLLDIKLDNDAEDIMRLMSEVVNSVEPSAERKGWKDRIVLGIWAAKYLPLAQKYFNGFPVMHIGFSTSYASHFLECPEVGFNMLFPMLVAPGGQRFLRDVRAAKRKVLSWTVNDEERMSWCIRRRLDGVITDDPSKFLTVCEKWDEVEDAKRKGWFELELSFTAYREIARIWLFIFFALWWFRARFMPVASRALIERKEKD